MSQDLAKTYLTGPQTSRRYGVNDRTIVRWEADTKLEFPKPMLVRGRKFFALNELETWERSRATPSSAKKAA